MEGDPREGNGAHSSGHHDNTQNINTSMRQKPGFERTLESILDLLLLVHVEEIHCFLGAHEPWCYPDATRYQESLSQWPEAPSPPKVKVKGCVSPQSGS